MFLTDDEKKCVSTKDIKEIELIINDFFKYSYVNNNTLLNFNERETLIDIIESILRCVIKISEDKSVYELINKLLDNRIKVKEPCYTESQLFYLTKKLEFLSKIPQPEQRSEAWYEYRNNRLTASDLFYVMDDNKSKINDLIKKKCGIEQPFKPGEAILHGIKFEPLATMIYEKRNVVNVIEYGCLPHPFIPFFGASPDGICGPKSKNKKFIGRMLDIKCPKSRPLTGFIPEVYLGQMQGQLEVCDLEYCDFLECDFKFFNNFDEYISDTKRQTFEKGIIFESYDTVEKKNEYVYCDIEISTIEEFNLWEEKLIDSVLESKNQEYIRTTFWYLNEYSCILVKRDKEWFTKNYYKIENFWNNVENAGRSKVFRIH